MRSGKAANELHGIDALPDQVAGVEVEAELLAVAQSLESSLGRIEIEGDFRGMDLQRELDSAFAKDIEDRVPAFRQQLEAVGDHFRRDWWK